MPEARGRGRTHILISAVDTLPLEEDVCRKFGEGRHQAVSATKKRLAVRQADDETWWRGSRTGEGFFWVPAKGDAAALLAAQETPEAKAAAKSAVVATAKPQVEATPVKGEFRAYQQDKGLTQLKLGQLLGLLQAWTSRWVNGELLWPNGTRLSTDDVAAMDERVAEALLVLLGGGSSAEVEAQPMEAEAEAEAEAEVKVEVEGQGQGARLRGLLRGLRETRLLATKAKAKAEETKAKAKAEAKAEETKARAKAVETKAKAKAAETKAKMPELLAEAEVKRKSAAEATAKRNLEAEALHAGSTAAQHKAMEAVSFPQAALPGVTDAAGKAAKIEYVQSGGDMAAALRAGAVAAGVAAGVAVAKAAAHQDLVGQLAAVATRGNLQEVRMALKPWKLKLRPSAYVQIAEPVAMELIDRAEDDGTLIDQLACMLDDGDVLSPFNTPVGLCRSDVRDRIRALLSQKATAARVAALRSYNKSHTPSGRPPTEAQLQLSHAFENPTDFQNWPEPLKQWAIRFGLHLRWLDLVDQPGGLRLRGLLMLNALAGCLELHQPGAEFDVLAKPAVAEFYAHKVPALGTDVAEWLLRSWYWMVNGKLEFMGCRDSAREIAYLLNSLDVRLRHSPAKQGEGAFAPYNIFTSNLLYLRVQPLTETCPRFDILLACRVCASRASERKFEAASTPGAKLESFHGMKEVQLQALQDNPAERLRFVADPANPAHYTPAGGDAKWCAAVQLVPGCPWPLDDETRSRFEEQNSLLSDAGQEACTEEALLLWDEQRTQPAAEDGPEEGDPASCERHYAGDETTLSLPPNCVFETCYAPCLEDPDAPAGLPTTQATGITVLIAGRQHDTRLAEPGAKRQRRAEPEAAAAMAVSPEG